MKKTLHILLVSIFAFAIVAQVPSFATCGFWARKAALNPINVQQKVDYVNMCWWNNFNDPYLNDYILKSIQNNHDAKQASWKVEEYRQFVKYQFGQELPSLSVAGDYIGAHFPDSVKGLKSNIFAIPFQANYEVDIFLKNHDKTKASKKTYEASKFDEKATYISLATNVATVYFNIVKLDKEISLRCQIVALEQEKLKREQAKFNRGVISATALNNAKKELESAKNTLEDTVKSREKVLTQLAVLTGDSPCNINEYKRISFDKLEYNAAIPSSVSSDVVFSRPDILAAESKLQKANIDVRVARKEFLPRISLTGLYSLSNIGAGSFGSWESTIAAVVAGATLDLFKGGMKFANLKIYKSRYEQMFEAYKQTDLTALKEINDSLFMVRQDCVVDQNTVKKLNIQKDNYNRSIDRFNRGVISCLQLLTEKEALINMELSRVNTKTNRLIDYLTLYKAVGGKL